MSKKQKVSISRAIELAVYNDLRFTKSDPGADYNSHWTATMTATKLYKIIASWESAVIFAAREGWVQSTAPHCSRDMCQSKNCTSYLYKRASPAIYLWTPTLSLDLGPPCSPLIISLLRSWIFNKKNPKVCINHRSTQNYFLSASHYLHLTTF